jgi:hypothetical protein
MLDGLNSGRSEMLKAKRDDQIKSTPITVQPHQKDGDELKHTDVAATALYNTIVSRANVEAQVVWQRYNSILIANSVILYAVNSTAMESHPRLKALLGVIGLLLCVLWGVLTWEGWHFWNTYSTMAARFRWPKIDDQVNVYEVMFDRFEQRGPRVAIAAFFIILLFIAIYLALLISALRSWSGAT